MNIEQARFNMIEQQIRPWNVLDESVLKALSTLKREDFVPLPYKALAFMDMAIPLGTGSRGEAMLSPKVEARMLQDLQIKSHEKVLEIGTGSGFMAALLATHAQFVTTLEINPELAKLASTHLENADIYNAKVIVADGSKTLPAAAQGQYDVIVLSGSVAEIPSSLLQLLKIGGRCMAITGQEPIMQATLVKRINDTAFETQKNWETSAPRLQNFAVAPAFTF